MHGACLSDAANSIRGRDDPKPGELQSLRVHTAMIVIVIDNKDQRSVLSHPRDPQDTFQHAYRLPADAPMNEANIIAAIYARKSTETNGLQGLGP